MHLWPPPRHFQSPDYHHPSDLLYCLKKLRIPRHFRRSPYPRGDRIDRNWILSLSRPLRSPAWLLQPQPIDLALRKASAQSHQDRTLRLYHLGVGESRPHPSQTLPGPIRTLQEVDLSHAEKAPFYTPPVKLLYPSLITTNPIDNRLPAESVLLRRY